MENEANPEANIIWGVSFDSELEDEMKVTIIATGFEKKPEDDFRPGNVKVNPGNPFGKIEQPAKAGTVQAQPEAKPQAKPAEPQKKVIKPSQTAKTPDDEMDDIFTMFNSTRKKK